MEEIDLKELFEIFWSKKVFIIVTTIIFAVAGLVYSKVLKEPKYTATAKMVLAQTSNNDAATITTTDLNINDKLIATYKDLAKSSTVVRTVMNNLNITDMTENELSRNINVSAKTGTQMLLVSVTDIDAYKATRITNELTTVFSEKVKEWYKIDNINVVDKAEVPSAPSNISHTKTTIMCMAVGFILSVAIIFVANMLDNSIRTASDIERAIKLPVLAELPQLDFNNNNMKKRRK